MSEVPVIDDLSKALKEACRSPGWNFRSAEIHCFALGVCTLFVVPARYWVDRAGSRSLKPKHRVVSWHA